MVLLQIHTTPLGQGLLSLATLLFNHPVCRVMPVLDRKLIGRDNDDKNHSKLVHRQHKNNRYNDNSPIFASIPIGSTVVVQWEDGGLWTHGTIVGKGDPNHYDWSYTIQLTTTGRRITHNRWHIKPTSIVADAYIWYQDTKNANRQNDLLDAILEHIKNNPGSYSNRTVQDNINNTQCTHNKWQPQNSPLHRRQEHIQRTITNTRQDNNRIQQDENVVKTSYGRMIRKSDRLTYQ